MQWKAIFTALEIQQDWIGDVFAFTWILVSEKHKIGCGGQSSASKPTKLWFRLPWPLIVKPMWAGWLMSSCLVSSWNGGDYWASLRGSLEDWAGCCVCIGRCSGKGPLVWNVDLMLLSNTAVLICFLRPLIPLLFHVENGRPCLVFAVIRQEALSPTHLTCSSLFSIASLLVWGKDLVLMKACTIVVLWVPPEPSL